MVLLSYSFSHHSLCSSFPSLAFQTIFPLTLHSWSLPQCPWGWDLPVHLLLGFLLDKVKGLYCRSILCLLSIYVVPLCNSNRPFHITSLLVPSLASTAFSLTCVLPPVIHHVADSKPLCVRLESGLVASLVTAPHSGLCLTCPVWQLALLSATS